MPRPAADLPALHEATFDEEDRSLFLVDDARLRADALKHSLLPRLDVVLRHCLDRVARVYDVDPLEHSRVSRYPNFRERRELELAHLYEQAMVGIGGTVQRGRWPGFSRARDDGPVQFVPFRLGLFLRDEGLGVLLENGWIRGLSEDSYRKLYDFHLEHADVVGALATWGRFVPTLLFDDAVPPIAPFRATYARMRDQGVINHHWTAYGRGYPVDAAWLVEAVEAFVAFFPVYDAYVQLGLGRPSRFEALVARLNAAIREAPDATTAGTLHDVGEDWPVEDEENSFAASDASAQGALGPAALQRARDRAAARTPVMPGWRWQVFQRDQWRCVACGRDASHGVVLHVDHIVPRSLGGPNELANYQTLCHVCNGGKSNRDSTDLRAERRRSAAGS